MSKQQIRTIYTFSLVVLDAIMVVVAFFAAYTLRIRIPWPDELANIYPLSDFVGFVIIQTTAIITTLFFYRQYYLPRAISRVDQVYYIAAGVSIGTLMAVAISTLFFKTSDAIINYPRTMILFSWVLSIIFLTIGRMLHQAVRDSLRDRGIGRDRVLVVGTGDTARIMLQRIIWSPNLGYELVGIVNGEHGEDEILGIPILGTPEDLPDLIETLEIDEVLIAIPEKGHREVVRIISYCERGRVTIKVFPDIFQFVTSQATIDDLGGLPLLSVRDFRLRGYLLIFKRMIDLLGSAIGLIILSPFMLLTAVAIKLESPGPVFFVQPRMSLDGKSFMMIKFRSMRNDAEKDGPGWTRRNDPRQTNLGKFLRRFEMDELPNLINVFLGEMSLVGPRPEQGHYVAQFQQIVPRYMERHREKGGMTGWAQVNGMRGDTSIIERTKFDLWYSENWSILLDTKILLRTVWQVFMPKRKQKIVQNLPSTEFVSQDVSQTDNPQLEQKNQPMLGSDQPSFSEPLKQTASTPAPEKI
ncbi:MAG: undecaprenyl-phosphate glucose phosphotransferase [Anaerolineales bacterium]|nr:undecaprenyl-phosphate glucose phosphotransferase [Anaerolineales bacterium]